MLASEAMGAATLRHASVVMKSVSDLPGNMWDFLSSGWGAGAGTVQSGVSYEVRVVQWFMISCLCTSCDGEIAQGLEHCCSSRGSVFDSQHPHVGSRPSIM